MTLNITSLSKKYNDFFAIDNISFNISKPGIYGLLGTNGAGKTTLMGMILGLILPTKGHIKIFGEEFTHKRVDILKKLNYESPYLDLPKKLTVKQNLIFYSRMYSVKDFLDKIHDLSNKLKISDLLDRQFGSLSAGQKTRVGICKSLVNDPKVLLLDEPTASLDPDTSIFIRNFLKKYQKLNKIIILIASHNMHEVEKICHRIIILNKGKIILDGIPKEILKNKKLKNLEQLFLRLSN